MLALTYNVAASSTWSSFISYKSPSPPPLNCHPLLSPSSPRSTLRPTHPNILYVRYLCLRDALGLKARDDMHMVSCIQPSIHLRSHERPIAWRRYEKMIVAMCYFVLSAVGSYLGLKSRIKLLPGSYFSVC